MGGSASTEEPVEWKPEKKANSVWRSGAFAGEFGDPFIKDTSLEGGTTAPSIDTLVEVVLHVLKNRLSLTSLDNKEADKVLKLCSELTRAAERERIRGTKPSNEEFVQYLEATLSELTSLKVGQRLVFTGGWRHMKGGHAIMYTVTRTATDQWSFAVSNTGAGVNYHPAKGEYPKIKRRTTMCFTGIPSDRMLSADFWAFLSKLYSYPQKDHGEKQIYEIAFPFLCGGNLPPDYTEDQASDFHTVQRAGTCYYRCVHAVTQYLLKQDGFSKSARKRITVAIRVGFLDLVLRDLKHATPSTFFDSDRRMIYMAAEQTAMQAVKLCKGEKPLTIDEMKEIKKLVTSVNQAAHDMVIEEEEKLDVLDIKDVPCKPFSPFVGFELLMENGDTDSLSGGAMEGTASLAVNLECPVAKSIVFGAEDAFGKTLVVIDWCRSQSYELLKKQGACASTTISYQICALIQKVFLDIVPTPNPRDKADSCVYHVAIMTRAQQSKCMTNLWLIMRAFCAASHSLVNDAATDAVRATVAAIMLAIFDKVLRVKPTDGRSLLVECLEKVCEKGQLPGLSATRFNECEPLEFLLERGLVYLPSVMRARSSVLKYFANPDLEGEANEKNTLFMWSMKGGGQSYSVGEEEDVIIRLVQEILRKLQMPNLPQEADVSMGWMHAHSRAAWQTNLETLTELQRAGRWLCYDWEKELPELQQMRDMHFLFRICLEPTKQLRMSAPWLPSNWGPTDMAPTWMANRNPDGTVSFRVGVVRPDNEFTCITSPGKSLSDVRSYVATAYIGGEEEVLFTDNLPSFDGMLSSEESERLMTYMTVPHLAVPLTLQFFAKGRVGCLVKPEIRKLLDAMLFEPREFQSDPKQIVQVPVPVKLRKEYLGTQWGLLMQEVMYSPVAVLRPLQQLLNSAIQLCLGDFRSSFVPVCLFISRIAVRMMRILHEIEERPDLPGESLRNDEVSAARQELNKSLVMVAENVRRWLAQSEAKDDILTSTKLQVHLILLVDAEEGPFTADRWDKLIRALSFVVSWHSKGMGMGMSPQRRYGRRYWGDQGDSEPAPPAELSDTPIADCFEVLDRRRIELLQWLASKPPELETVLSHAAGAALNREVSGGSDLTRRGWLAMEEKPLMCELVLESPHPYRPSTDDYCHVKFPGAAYISLYFDDKCNTEKAHDFVTIYKDKNFASHWGPSAQLSGMGDSGNWPGIAGRPPLVVASDEFYLHFHSDATTEQWGWKLIAVAPINQEAVPSLAETLVKQGDAPQIPELVRKRAAQKALAACRNDLGPGHRAEPLQDASGCQTVSAADYLQKHAARLVEEATKELADIDTNQRSTGKFQDPTGSVEVNLQTCEVYLQGRILMPTPSVVLDHPDFAESLDRATNEMPFCAIRDRSANRLRLTLLQNDRTYEISRWGPLIPQASAGLTESEKPLCGGLCDLQSFGMPRVETIDGTKCLQFSGCVFKPWDYTQEVDEEQCSWGIKTLGPMLLDAIDSAKLDNVPNIWRADTLNTDNLEEHLLMHVPASGAVEDRKNHPGGIFEIVALRSRRLLQVFALREQARCMQRQLVWTSDSGLAFQDMMPSLEERFAPWPQGTQHAGGNMFDTVMTGTGTLLPHPYKDADTHDSAQHGTLSIRRARFPSTARLPARMAKVGGQEWSSEVFVPARFIVGLLPEALSEQYSFWRTGPLTIRGYPRDATNETELLVTVSRPDGKSGPETSVATVHRLTKCAAQSGDGTQNQEGSDATAVTEVRPFLLLNPQRAPSGGMLWQLSEAMKRFETAGWVLFWTEAEAEIGEEAACSLVELPRLRLRFAVVDGHLRSLEYDGLQMCKTLPPAIRKLCKGLPHSLVLENPTSGGVFVLLPNYEPKVIDITTCPLNTELVLLRSNNFLAIPATRYYLYPVHASHKFLQTASLPAALYLLLLRLLRRDYLDAAEIVDMCFTDVPYSPEEQWLLQMLRGTESDKHPNAIACRLRLALMSTEVPGEGKNWSVDDDLPVYVECFSHVSQTCRLTLDEELLLSERLQLGGPRTAYIEALRKRRAGEDAEFSEVPPSKAAPGGQEIKDLLKKFSPPKTAKAVMDMLKGVRYKQPLPAEQDGAGGLSNVLDMGKDTCIGRERQLGFCFLYDLIIGKLRVSWRTTSVPPNPMELTPNRPFNDIVEEEGKKLDKVHWEINPNSAADGKDAEGGTSNTTELWEPDSDTAGIESLYQEFLVEQSNSTGAASEEGKKKEEAPEEGKMKEKIQEANSPDDEADLGNWRPLGPRSGIQVDFTKMLKRADGKVIKMRRVVDEPFQSPEVTEAVKIICTARPSPSTGNVVLGKLLAQSQLLKEKNMLAMLLVCTANLFSSNDHEQAATLRKVCDSFPAWPSDIEEWKKEVEKGLKFECTASKVFALLLPSALKFAEDTETWRKTTSSKPEEPGELGTESVEEVHKPPLCPLALWDERVTIANCLNATQFLKPVCVDPRLAAGTPDVQAFATVPLGMYAADVVKFVHKTRSETLEKLPFNFGDRPFAQTENAKLMLERLEADVRGKWQKAQTAEEPWLTFMSVEQLAEVKEGGARGRTALCNALDRLQGSKALGHENALEAKLKSYLTTESEAIFVGVAAIEELANKVEEETVETLAFELQRLATVRGWLQFENLAAATLSTTATQDLMKINPYCKMPSRWQELLDSVCVLLLRSVRLAQIRTCLGSLKALRVEIEGALRALEPPPHDDDASEAMVNFVVESSRFEPVAAKEALARLCQTVRDVASQLCAKVDGLSSEKAASVVRLCLEVQRWDAAKATQMILQDPNGVIEIFDRSCRRCADKQGRSLPEPSFGGIVAKASEWEGKREVISQVLSHSSQNLAIQVAARRHYMGTGTESNVTFDCRFLVFEYMVGFMLRKRQVELVQDFARDALAGKSSVHQMIMGQGKTTVISPMLCLLLADGTRLITQIVPAELLEMSTSVLRNCFQDVVKKRIYTLTFDRSSLSSNSIDPIVWLRKKMENARKQSAIVCTSPGAVKSLFLKYVELLHSIAMAPEPLRCPFQRLGSLKTKAKKMGQKLNQNGKLADELALIIRHWGTSSGGVALLDEVDLLTDPMKSELNYPIGAKLPLDGHEFRWDLPIFLLDGMFRVLTGQLNVPVQPSAKIEDMLDGIAVAISEGHKAQKIVMSPHFCLLRKDFYKEKVCKPMAHWAMVWLKDQPAIESALHNVCKESQKSEPLSKEQVVQSYLIPYVCGQLNPSQLAQLSLPADAMRMLNLSRDWVTGFLPYVLSKVCRVSFGLLHPEDIERWSRLEGKKVEMPLSRKLLAVPFVGKDVPSRNAEFAHPEVLIGLAVLAYRYEGLREEDMKKTITALKSEMQYQPGPFVTRPARILFQDWLEGAARSRAKVDNEGDDEEDLEVLPLELLKPEDDDQFNTAFKLLRNHPPVGYYYLQKLVFPTVMRHQNQKLTASGVDLAGTMLFDVRLGFSGTPSDLLPLELRPCHFEPGSEAEMIQVLTSPDVVTHQLVNIPPEQWTVLGLLKRIAEGTGRNGRGFAALIDCGALVTGFSNEEVARKLLELGLKDMDACVYLDASDAKMVVDRSGGRPVPMSRSGVRKERRFTFYDQVHTTGMDIKQGFDSCAVVTLGKDMVWRDYAQGCYRMRGLGKGQTLHVMVVGEVFELIREVSETPKILVDIVAWLLSNSMRSGALQNIALVGQILSNTWRRQALSVLLDTKTPKVDPAYPLTSRFWKHVPSESVAATLERTTLLDEQELLSLEVSKVAKETKAMMEQLKLVLGQKAMSEFERTYNQLIQSTSKDELLRARMFRDKLRNFIDESGISIDAVSLLSEEERNRESERLLEVERLEIVAKKDLDSACEQVAQITGKDRVDEVLKPMKEKIEAKATKETAVRFGWSLVVHDADEAAPGKEEIDKTPDRILDVYSAPWNHSPETVCFSFQVMIEGPDEIAGNLNAFPGLWNEALLEQETVSGRLFFDPENPSGMKMMKREDVEGCVVLLRLPSEVPPEKANDPQEAQKLQTENEREASRAIRFAMAAGAVAVLFACPDERSAQTYGWQPSKKVALDVRKPYPKIPAFVVLYEDGVALEAACGRGQALKMTGSTRLKNPVANLCAQLALETPIEADVLCDIDVVLDWSSDECQLGVDVAPLNNCSEVSVQNVNDEGLIPSWNKANPEKAITSSVSTNTFYIIQVNESQEVVKSIEEYKSGGRRGELRLKFVKFGSKTSTALRGQVSLAPVSSGQHLALASASMNGARALVLWLEEENLTNSIDAIPKMFFAPEHRTIPTFFMRKSAGEMLRGELGAGKKLTVSTSFELPKVNVQQELLSAFIGWAKESGYTVELPSTYDKTVDPIILEVPIAIVEDSGALLTDADYESEAEFWQLLNDCPWRVPGFDWSTLPDLMALVQTRCAWLDADARDEARVSNKIRVVQEIPAVDFGKKLVIHIDYKGRFPASKTERPARFGDAVNPMLFTVFVRVKKVIDNENTFSVHVLEGNAPASAFGLTPESLSDGSAELLVYLGASLSQADIDSAMPGENPDVKSKMDRMAQGEFVPGDAVFVVGHSGKRGRAIVAENKEDGSLMVDWADGSLSTPEFPFNLSSADPETMWTRRLRVKNSKIKLAEFVSNLKANRSADVDITKEADEEPQASDATDPAYLTSSIELFVEDLDLSLKGSPLIPRPYHQVLQDRVAHHTSFLEYSPETKVAALKVIEDFQKSNATDASEDQGDDLGRNMQVVQEQQQEEEREQEQQREQQLQKDYAKNPELDAVWPVEKLNTATSLIPSNFYPGRALQVLHRSERSERPPEAVVLPLPDQFLVSENFAPFLLHSDLPRRLKNVEVLLNWIPSEVEQDGGIGDVEAHPPAFQELIRLSHLSLATVQKTTADNARPSLSIVLSLSESESLRRHLVLRAAGGTSQLVERCVVDLVTVSGLNLTPTAPADARPQKAVVSVLDNVANAGEVTQPLSAGSENELNFLSFSELQQCARFFDAQLWFTDDEVIQILRAVTGSAESQRRQAFDVLVSSRRRDRCAWEGTPVAQVFAHADETMLIRLRLLVSNVKDELARRELLLRDVFALWDANKDGWLSQEELYSALKALIPTLSEQDIIELLHHGDSSGDGFLDYREFAAQFGAGSEEEAALARKKAVNRRRGTASQQKVSALKQLQGLTDDTKGGQSQSSASPLPAMQLEAKSWQSIAALGTLSLTSGGFVQFHGDGRVSTQPGHRPTIKPRFVSLTSGAWYWEVTVIVAGRASIGWATPNFQGDSQLCIGIGDDENSWGFDGYSKTLRGWGTSASFGLRWSPGDVVGMALDCDQDQLQWYLNGESLGSVPALPQGLNGLVPGLSFDSAFQCLVNFGKAPFRYRPPFGFRSVWSWVTNTQERQHAVLAGARLGKFQCSSGAQGMRIKGGDLTFTGGFPSATLAGVLLTRGKWYYEIKNIAPSMAPQHGWADLDFVGASRSGVGVGDDKHSWGYDGARAPSQGLWADGPVNFGLKWNPGDICGVAADLESRRLSYSLNGSWEKPMGVAAQSIAYVCGLSPALTSQGGQVLVNLGETPFAHSMPPGYSSVNDWIKGMKAQLAPSGTEPAPQEPVSLIRGVSMMHQDKMTGVTLRVHSGHTHAILELPDNIVSARDGYPSFVAHDLLLSKGHWAFEAEVLGYDEGEKRRARYGANTQTEKPSVCIGWADKRFFGDYVRNSGVGDDSHSWGWYLSEGEGVQYKNNGESTVVDGEGVNVGDVLTFTIAMHLGCARLFVNGKLRHVVEDITPAVGLLPAVSVKKGVKLQMRFGPNLAQFTPTQAGEDLQTASESAGIVIDLQSHLRMFEDCKPVSEWAHVHAPSSRASSKIERATSAGPPPSQPVKMERATSAAKPATASGLQRTVSISTSLPLGKDMPGDSESARLHMEQLKLAAQLVMSDSRRSGDTEMQSLLQKVMEATSQKLGPDGR